MKDRDTVREITRRIDRYINIEKHYLQDTLDLNPEVQEVAVHQRTIIKDLECIKKTLEQQHREYVKLSKLKKISF